MKNLTKSIFLLIFLICVMYIFLHIDSIIPISSSTIRCKDCNVILISLDTVRADHLGCYGYFRNTSPNIDSLANSSILFKNGFSQSPHTTASHMSIFTSLYPSSHGVMIPFEDILNPKIVTIAQILEMNNYTTFWIGPLNNECLDLKKGFERGFEYFIEDWEIPNKTLALEKGMNQIKENKDGKFFIFWHTYRAHSPYLSSTIFEFINRTDEKIVSSKEKLWNITVNNIIADPSILFKNSFIKENEGIFTNKSLLRDSIPELCTNSSNLNKGCSEIYIETFWKSVNLSNDSDMDYVKMLYDSEIYASDQDFKILVDMLKDENLMNKTIIIITSDHGEEFMDHGNTEHSRTLYDEVIHVPLIIWIPGFKGKDVSSLVQSIDIMPTIFDLLGMNIPRQTQGVSLLPLVEGKASSLDKYVFGETPFGDFGYLSSIRSNDWKLIKHSNNSMELYDLKDDPKELNNVIDKFPNITNELKNNLDAWEITKG